MDEGKLSTPADPVTFLGTNRTSVRTAPYPSANALRGGGGTILKTLSVSYVPLKHHRPKAEMFTPMGSNDNGVSWER